MTEDADLSPDGRVIYVPGEGGPSGTWQYAPGALGNALYTVPDAAKLKAVSACFPAQAWYLSALLPGWQKWKPTHRYGTITAIDYDADTCTVLLDAAKSSQQGLNINLLSVLVNVPVQYMTCNAAAFEVGDSVLVQFTGQSWDSPVVIGFKANPKPCAGWIFNLTRGDGARVDESMGVSFQVYTSAAQSVYPVTKTYLGEGKWGIEFPDSFKDPNGYLIFHRCSFGLSTVYPGKYLT
jgi:hypothetical protein